MEAITESQGPLLSLPHSGALIVDAVATATLTRPHVGPTVFAGEERQRNIGRLLAVDKQQQQQPTRAEPHEVKSVCANRRENSEVAPLW